MILGLWPFPVNASAALAHSSTHVIPGRREAANPESILRSSGYGFRVRAHSASETRVNALAGAPRNDIRCRMAMVDVFCNDFVKAEA